MLLRALSKQPEERFPSIVDFASALSEAASQPAAAPEPAEVNSAVLEISQDEAAAGISRLVTLAGGEEITVSVPAGARHGQILRLPGPASAGDQDGVVLVNIAIQPQQEAPAPESASVEPVPQTPALVSAREVRAAPAPEAPPLHLRSRPDSAQAPVPAPDEPTLLSQGGLKQITELPRPVAVLRRSRLRPGLLALLVLCVLLVLGGSILAFASRQNPVSRAQVTPTHTALTSAPTPLASATVSTPTPAPGLNIAGKYNGSMAANNGSNYTALTIQLAQSDGSGVLTGTATLTAFSPQGYPLQGTDDLQGNFTLVAQPPAGQQPLIFYGGLQNGNFLHGYYCHAAAPPCKAAEGYFNVGPRY